MDQKPNWNFPDNNHTRVYGFDTTDMETFKKDPVSHFAREICQNSIDARKKDNPNPVRIEFKSFMIHNTRVPEMPALKYEMNVCRNYMSQVGKKAYQKKANDIYENICGGATGYIQCLRVSDFNTTGLYGSKSHKLEEPFYALTRGSGSSDKGSGSAGSKGIGKYAAFVISKTNTVFYSTHAFNPKTNEVEDAYCGISKLCSRPLDDDELYTFGEGYYGIGEQNYPIMSQLNLDPNFSRDGDEYGTDLYIIGFNEGDGDSWKMDILEKVLDSFIVAIMNGSLEVNIDGVEINRNTVSLYVSAIKKRPRLTSVNKGIISQYDIIANLEDDSVKRKTIKIFDHDIDFYAKVYQNNESDFATHKCARVRYPYMKIDDIRLAALAPVSAMCIIGNNEINDILRSIENPQHTEWQKKRARDDKEEYEKVQYVLQRLSDEMNTFIAEMVTMNGVDSTDFEGAGEYLPDEGSESGEEGKESETPSEIDETIVSTPKRRMSHIPGKKAESDEGDPDTVHSLGEINEDGDNLGTVLRTSQGQWSGPGPEHGPNPDPNPDPEEIDIYGPGFNPYLKHILSKNMHFRCMKPSNIDSYEITFSANTTQNDCEIQLSSIGDSNDVEKVEIESASINGVPAQVIHGRIVHFPIEFGKEYKVSCKINRDEAFASKVEMYAYQE